MWWTKQRWLDFYLLFFTVLLLRSKLNGNDARRTRFWCRRTCATSVTTCWRSATVWWRRSSWPPALRRVRPWPWRWPVSATSPTTSSTGGLLYVASVQLFLFDSIRLGFSKRISTCEETFFHGTILHFFSAVFLNGSFRRTWRRGRRRTAALSWTPWRKWVSVYFGSSALL